jgi:predicted RNase H-like HicB family nuclease
MEDRGWRIVNRNSFLLLPPAERGILRVVQSTRIGPIVANSRMKYLVVIEKGDASWGAYVPDLPGCVAVADSREKVVELIREAVEFHLEDLRENGDVPPQPSSEGEVIEINAA